MPAFAPWVKPLSNDGDEVGVGCVGCVPLSVPLQLSWLMLPAWCCAVSLEQLKSAFQASMLTMSETLTKAGKILALSIG